MQADSEPLQQPHGIARRHGVPPVSTSWANAGRAGGQLLGGRVRESVEFASYLFFRLPNDKTGEGRGALTESARRACQSQQAEHGFATPKLKAGLRARLS